VTALDAGTGPFNLRGAREAEWQRLDALVTLAEKKSPRALSDEDLMALPVLYRSALSSLSVARETSLDLELITYLESLCARAYFFVYGVRTSPWRRMQAFFAHDWPAAVRSLWRETIIATMLTVVGTIAGFLLVRSDPLWYDAFVPEGLASGRNFAASTEFLRGTLYDSQGKGMLSIFATFLFTHNAQVSIMAFALGFAFGVPTAFVLIYNGGMLGAFFALFGSKGLGVELGGWLIIHGTTELFAIILAGAAGLRIGWSVVFPGEVSRLSAATTAGRTAGIAMAGVVVMLFVAGMLEGIGRQTITNDLVRYAIGIAMLLLWLLFYYLPRRSAHG
jgi:uncharacterized membrane protein SpoIIM required for sporulation